MTIENCYSDQPIPRRLVVPMEEVEALLEHHKNHAVRVREGGGLEDYWASIVVTMAKMEKTIIDLKTRMNVVYGSIGYD